MSDITSLDLNLLKTLDALLDERSVTRAAARLALTQPAVSGMLARLRTAFGDPLFVRNAHGIVPTARATELAGPVKRLLSDATALMQPPDFIPAAAELHLRIAATDYAVRAAIAPFLVRLWRQAPKVRVSLHPAITVGLQEQLEKGELDLALMTPESTPPDLHARLLFEERYVCVMRAAHPAAAQPLTLERFCAFDHALVSLEGGRFWGIADDMLASAGCQRRVLLSANSFLAALEILRGSDLIATVPSRLATGLEGIVTHEPPLQIPGFAKAAVWHERTHRSPAHRWLRDLLVSSVKEERTSFSRRKGSVAFGP